MFDGELITLLEELLFLSTFLDMNKVIGAVSCDYMLVDDNEEILSRKNSKNYPIAVSYTHLRAHET